MLLTPQKPKSVCAGDHGGTLRQLESVLAAQPDHGPALALMGISLMLAGDLDDAVVTLKQAVAVLPDDETTRINLGNALRAQAESRLTAGQLQEARDGLLDALEHVPDDIQALLVSPKPNRNCVTTKMRSPPTKPISASNHNRRGFISTGVLPARVAAIRGSTSSLSHRHPVGSFVVC
ncbi:MAG: tetratricopeptide repeat protein [Candidatus Competibacteraceae bacterium]